MKALKLSVEDAIKSIREGDYAGTYLKIELEGHLERDYDDFDGGGEYDNEVCDDFMISNVSSDCLKATVYHDFVYDGSVDSEFKATVPLTWEGLGYAIEYLKAFKLLAEQIGNGLDVTNAGMHLTVLRSENGDYPYNNGTIDDRKYDNFKKSMDKLMPALFLLASEDHKSRGLSFRMPRVSEGDHGSAIDIAGGGGTGVLEWRVFETCYDHPEMLYDFICVIAKGLEFYSDNPKPVRIGKIGRLEFYDNPREYGVHKYFHTEKHLDALNKGLRYLLPDHRTVGEVKKLHSFKVTKTSLATKRNRLMGRVEDDYAEYIADAKEREDRWIEHRVNDENQTRVYIRNARPMIPSTEAKFREEMKIEYRKLYRKPKAKYLQEKLDKMMAGIEHPSYILDI